jgi:hypothetical protein
MPEEPTPADVFCKPSVEDKRLGLEITVSNPTVVRRQRLQVENRSRPLERTRRAARPKRHSPQGNGNWLTPAVHEDVSWMKRGTTRRLWWPDRPHLYWVVTTFKQDGKVVDVKRTRFGFRQWKWDSHMFTLNGVKWPMWADTNYTDSPQSFTEAVPNQPHEPDAVLASGMWGGMTRRRGARLLRRNGHAGPQQRRVRRPGGQLRRRPAGARHVAAQGRTGTLSTESQTGTVRPTGSSR